MSRCLAILFPIVIASVILGLMMYTCVPQRIRQVDTKPYHIWTPTGRAWTVSALQQRAKTDLNSHIHLVQERCSLDTVTCWVPSAPSEKETMTIRISLHNGEKKEQIGPSIILDKASFTGKPLTVGIPTAMVLHRNDVVVVEREYTPDHATSDAPGITASIVNLKFVGIL